jgi:hypothetical protein
MEKFRRAFLLGIGLKQSGSFSTLLRSCFFYPLQQFELNFSKCGWKVFVLNGNKNQRGTKIPSEKRCCVMERYGHGGKPFITADYPAGGLHRVMGALGFGRAHTPILPAMKEGSLTYQMDGSGPETSPYRSFPSWAAISRPASAPGW